MYSLLYIKIGLVQYVVDIIAEIKPEITTTRSFVWKHVLVQQAWHEKNTQFVNRVCKISSALNRQMVSECLVNAPSLSSFLLFKDTLLDILYSLECVHLSLYVNRTGSGLTRSSVRILFDQSLRQLDFFQLF